MLDEHDANRMWQQLFRGQAITSETLAEAETVVNGLSPESPLRLRLSTELEEIRSLQLGQRPKKKR
jgi:hypothetical protein